MAFAIRMVDVWAADIRNRPGMLARLLEALTNAGAHLEFIVGRRVSENTSRVFIWPIHGARVLNAAQDVGMTVARGMHVLRIEGPDRPGLGAELTRTIAAAGINLRGVSGAAIGDRCVMYLGFATDGEARAAESVARRTLSGARKTTRPAPRKKAASRPKAAGPRRKAVARRARKSR